MLQWRALFPHTGFPDTPFSANRPYTENTAQAAPSPEDGGTPLRAPAPRKEPLSSPAHAHILRGEEAIGEREGRIRTGQPVGARRSAGVNTAGSTPSGGGRSRPDMDDVWRQPCGVAADRTVGRQQSSRDAIRGQQRYRHPYTPAPGPSVQCP